MKNKMKMRKLNQLGGHKGFSLIEIVIAIAILAVVSVTIVLAMTSSSKIYSKSSVEAQLQSEAEVVANAISEIAIDAADVVVRNDGVNVDEWLKTLQGGESGAEAGAIKTNYKYGANEILILEATENVGTMAAPVYRKVQYVVAQGATGTANAGKLFMAKRQKSDTDTWEAMGDFDLLGNYITGFTVDTTRVQEDNLLGFTLGYTKKALSDRTYTGNYQVMMRNRAYSRPEPEEPEIPEDIRLIAGITPKFVYPCVRNNTIADYYVDAVIDDPKYTRSIVSPITFSTTYISNQSASLLSSHWNLPDSPDGLFTLPSDAGETGLVTSKNLVINSNGYDFKTMGYDNCFVNYYLTTENKDGVEFSSATVSSEIRMLRVKDLQIQPMSGFATEWNENWAGEKPDYTPIKGYAYANSSGKIVDMVLNAKIEGTEWMPPAKGGAKWELEVNTGSGFVPCPANFAKLATTESATSTMNTLQFGKSAASGQLYKIKATSLFDPSYDDEIVIAVGKIGGGNGDGCYSRGYYIDLNSWMEKDYDFTGNITDFRIASQGNVWENESIEIRKDPATGRIYLCMDYDSFAYTNPDQRIQFYDGSGEVKFYVYEDGKSSYTMVRGSSTVEYRPRPVKVTKVSPSTSVIVVPKGGSKLVKVKTRYYNLLNSKYFGIFVDDMDTNLNREGMTDYDKYLKVQTESGYGDKYNYVDEMAVSVTPKTGLKDYNPNPQTLRLTALDYYILAKAYPDKQDYNNENCLAASCTDYTVYIANVQGVDVFFPGPKSKDGVDGLKVNYNSLSSTETTVKGYDANGNVIEGKVYTKNNKTMLKYNGTEYSYNKTYCYWSK